MTGRLCLSGLRRHGGPKLLAGARIKAVTYTVIADFQPSEQSTIAVTLKQSCYIAVLKGEKKRTV